jgi:hypothetical protein
MNNHKKKISIVKMYISRRQVFSDDLIETCIPESNLPMLPVLTKRCVLNNSPKLFSNTLNGRGAYKCRPAAQYI